MKPFDLSNDQFENCALLRDVIDKELDSLEILDEIAFEDLREFHLCLDRHPDYLIAAAERMATSLRFYQRSGKALIQFLTTLQALFPDDDKASSLKANRPKN